MNGLFLNSQKAQCSIHESGKMIYNALKLSTAYKLDYVEVGANSRTIPDTYDFYVFNYHPYTMGWLDTLKIKNLAGLKISIILETLPNDPFAMCSSDDFDAYCVIDPTIKSDNRNVYGFSRPLESPVAGRSDDRSEIPIIGTFGFATAGKGFEYVVAAVNKEFDKATIRMNIPAGSYIRAKKTILPTNPTYADKLEERCMNLVKEGIELQITHDYMSKQQLINWCASNTLNVFLYSRNQPGLSATTDQAISSGRPLAVSDNETFRHIHQYMVPYPKRSLKESIRVSEEEVFQMQIDWQPEEFARRFEELLEAEKGKAHIPTVHSGKPIVLPKKGTIHTFYHMNRQRLNFFLHPVDEHIPNIQFDKPNVLMISQKERMCGIYQYGRNITNTLRRSKKYNFMFCECGNATDLNEAVLFYKPIAIIYNYYPPTMRWIVRQVTKRYNVPHLAIVHEFDQRDVDMTTNNIFDYSLYQDPGVVITNPYAFSTKQLLYPYTNTKPLPEIPTIGSFGFGFSDKGFERLVRQVQKEFNEAIINIHMPFNDVVDPHGTHAKRTAARCRSELYKPGVTLNITHDFWTEPQLLDFLAGNTINCFFTDTTKHLGISGATHHALAVHRPIAITKCPMYRDIWDAEPSICIEDSSLKEILANGLEPLEPFYKAWSEEEFIKDYEGILEKVLE